MLKKSLVWLIMLALVLSFGAAALASAEPAAEASGEAAAEVEVEAEAEAEAEVEDPLADPVFPEDVTIVSATMYSLYTKLPDSPQDAVIEATLYWDLTNDELFAVRFLQPMLPWDDNGADLSWAYVSDEALLEALEQGDALVAYPGGLYFAKYLEIGGILWTGELSTHASCGDAVEYYAEIDGERVAIIDFVSDQEGGKWFMEAARQPVKFLTADGETVLEYQITYKETNGHGVYYWLSDLSFPGNMDAIKAFVAEYGFDYDYYADGGMTQNEDGYWQTPDAVTGATLDETPTYLDMLKTLYNEIQAGNYVVESEPAAASAEPSGEVSGEVSAEPSGEAA